MIYYSLEGVTEELLSSRLEGRLREHVTTIISDEDSVLFRTVAPNGDGTLFCLTQLLNEVPAPFYSQRPRHVISYYLKNASVPVNNTLDSQYE